MDRGKVRIRSVSSTALIYCEGAHDLAFIRYLVRLYSQDRELATQFRARQGKGGSPDSLIREALNVPGSFDRRLLKADKDRPKSEIEATELLAHQHGIVIVWSTPCIEALLLAILDGKDYSRSKSKTCKTLFEANHIPSNRRSDMRSYEKLFPISVIEEAVTRLDELASLINFIIA